MDVCEGVLEEGAACGTSREGGLVEWREWQGTVTPCGLMASSFFTPSKNPSRRLAQQIWISPKAFCVMRHVEEGVATVNFWVCSLIIEWGWLGEEGMMSSGLDILGGL